MYFFSSALAVRLCNAYDYEDEGFELDASLIAFVISLQIRVHGFHFKIFYLSNFYQVDFESKQFLLTLGQGQNPDQRFLIESDQKDSSASSQVEIPGKDLAWKRLFQDNRMKTIDLPEQDGR